MTSGRNDAAVDASVTSSFSTLAGVVKATGGSLSANAKGIAATAVDELGRAALDALIRREVIASAKRAQAPLVAIAHALSSEAILESDSQRNSLALLAASQGQALSRVWRDPTVSAEGRFDVWERVMAERDVQSVLVTEKEINRSLADLVRANAALAAGNRQSFGVLANSAFLEAQHASSYYQETAK